jgi:hypothetical protein
MDMLSRELQLRGRMIVTLPDFELAAVDTPGVGRAYAVTTAARDVTVYLTDPEGLPVPAEVKATLADVYAQGRIVNTTVNLDDASYSEIDVTYSVAANPGFEPGNLIDSVNALLTNALSPSGWGVVTYGQPGTSPSSWINDSTVRLNKIISIIGNYPGVAYVVANSVQINGVEDDFVMPGPVALPTPGTMTGTVTP